jgi:hypothetical protein
MKILIYGVTVADILESGKRSNLEELLSLIDFDEEEFCIEHGFDAIDYNDFELVY